RPPSQIIPPRLHHRARFLLPPLLHRHLSLRPSRLSLSCSELHARAARPGSLAVALSLSCCLSPFPSLLPPARRRSSPATAIRRSHSLLLDRPTACACLCLPASSSCLSPSRPPPPTSQLLSQAGFVPLVFSSTTSLSLYTTTVKSCFLSAVDANPRSSEPAVLKDKLPPNCSPIDALLGLLVSIFCLPSPCSPRNRSIVILPILLRPTS
ncbi:hypothetical protein BDY21DRAFT_12109, partial [Lineolata rhizophorae]